MYWVIDSSYCIVHFPFFVWNISFIYNMKLEYKDDLRDSSFVLANFNCTPSQQLLEQEGYYKIIWVKEKEHSIIVDGYTINLMPDQILFCTPRNVLRILKESGIIAVLFNREFYCIGDHDYEVSCNGVLFFGSSAPPVINLSAIEAENFDMMFSIFKEEFELKDRIQGEMLQVMLKRLLIKSTRLLKDKKLIPNMPKAQFYLIRKFHILVERHFKTKHKVSEYAKKLYKSPKTLSNLFNKAGYPTPLNIINERIILEARRLLLFSDLNAEEIAYELGYKEGAHFSKFFKSHVGIPPIKFREQQISNQ